MATGDRVSILGLNYAPEPTGNAPYTAGLAQYLAAQGREVTAITTFPHYPQWRRYPGYTGWRRATVEDGVRVIRLKHLIPRPARGLRRLVSELTFGVRLALTSWHRPDAVVLVSPALFSSWLAMARLLVQRRPRRIVWVQDLYSQGMAETGEGGGFATRVVGAVEGWTLRRAHRVVAIHPAMATRITATFRVDRDKITVIPNWGHITPSPLSPPAAREALGWPQAFTALHAGNMGLKQGLEVVVDAARVAAQRGTALRIVLLGDGGERARLEAASAGLANLVFVDPLDEAQFPIALAAADVLLITEAPGIAEMAAPSKLTSYFAAARPVVASVADHGIVADIMARAGAGPVVDGGDTVALHDALVALSAGPADAAEFGARAYAYWARHLGPEGALTAWAELLNPANLEPASQGETP